MRSSHRHAGPVLVFVAVFSLVVAPASRAWAAPGLLEGEGALSASSGEAVVAFADLVARLFLLGIFLSDADDSARRGHDDETRAQYDDYGGGRRRRVRDSREGFLFSFGLGGGSMLVSPQGRAGSFQGNLRLGYGFSDRFQFFFDVTGAGTSYSNN
jgi:hypothetical protein